MNAFLIPVLVAIATAAITRFTFPTLHQRLRRHAALLKELPSDGTGAASLRNLVDREAAALAARDGRFFDRWLANPRAVRSRLIENSPAAVSLLLGAGAAVSAASGEGERQGLAVVAGGLIFASFFVGLILYFGLRRGRDS